MAKELILNDTLSGKRVFQPIDPKNVKMYVCGPTIYDHLHVGNTRPLIVFDLLYRILLELYPKVTYVRNITDVDDKIINAQKNSPSLGSNIQSFLKYQLQEFSYLVDKLYLLPVMNYKVSSNMEAIRKDIDKLHKSGYAYEKNGTIYFRNKNKLLLSKRSSSSNAVSRLDFDDNKENQTDFVLWKPELTSSLAWEYPNSFGIKNIKGRPGWHIECTSISTTHLGKQFDIHGGGQDLIFPHHENEIEQSFALHNCLPANYWIHNGFVTVGNQKMAKSSDNKIGAINYIESYGELVYKFYMLMTHYQSPKEWSLDGIKEASNIIKKFEKIIKDSGKNVLLKPKVGKVPDEFLEPLLNNMNTPEAFAVLHKFYKKKEYDKLILSLSWLNGKY